ncbi:MULTISPECIES: inositol monophosphatase family protein [Pirellulaceae]|uniref:Inositol-1-monophosphatase n=1 Tax=Aporhodopirellula rubra TaxID=980271 RepID=A0A7W5H8T1_9BACT|nr:MULTISPECIES: inositol monophosphatase family protein [Pirellulaceae]EMI46376.1 inositol-1-monophosphatase [Rhodopirellula sp. SWK7]MBB3209724.1 myo-inositol-1(or 4)-monophosphatase [Aporhodopirellula rubra]
MDNEHLHVAVEAARAGARELMARYENRVVSEKGPKDLVTDADLAAQAAIRKILEASYPDYAFVGEEEGETEPLPSVREGAEDAPPCWVVDPLDGTVNYVHRLQSFAVSIALYAKGKMRLGVIYDPTRDEWFTAIDGQGAMCNDRPMKSSDAVDLNESLVACSFRAGVTSDSPEVGRFVRVLERCRSLRRLGSCALNMCYVADGRLDAYWATNVAAWDSAAGTVIAREAGATLSGYDGHEFDDWSPKFCVAATPQLHAALIEQLTA